MGEVKFDYTVLASYKAAVSAGVRIIVRGDRRAIWINGKSSETGEEVCILRVADIPQLEIVDESGRSILGNPDDVETLRALCNEVKRLQKENRKLRRQK